MDRVIIDMNNRNALISLAYIETSDNPLQVFCNFILYLLLKAPEQSLHADILKDCLQNEFGISMPQQIINNCIRLMEKRGEVARLPHGAGYKIEKTSFDIDKFEKTRLELHEHEKKLLQSLIEFVGPHYKKTWSIVEAKEYLSTFLDKEGYGAELFLKKKLELDQSHVSPSLYIGRYISHLQRQDDSIESAYLNEIVYGMMVLQGIRQTGDYQQNYEQKFRGTVFYFDTKLVLRALGFSWKAQVDSAREMVRLLREKYDAEIGIFQQTLLEVRNALATAGYAIKHNKSVCDIELKLYSELYPDEAKQMEGYAENIGALLTRELGIDSITTIDRNTENARNYNIDVEGITDYIENKCGWRRNAIYYDAEIINQINILRKGDYSRPYGGKAKLPVFVTSNSKLAYTFRDYILSDANKDRRWSSHALPVISDNMLLYRIWLPFAAEFAKLPSLTLSRFAYAAQSEGVVFFEKMREVASGLEQTRNIDLISTTEAARRKIEDILLRETDGNIDAVTDEAVATSLGEYVRMEKLELLEENKSLTDHAISRDQQVIELLAEGYINRLGIGNRLLLLISKYWWIIATATLYLITAQISSAPRLVGISLLPIVLQVILYVIDKTVDDAGVRFRLYPRAIKYVEKQYTERIAATLKKKGYEDDIDSVVTCCIERTKVFNK